MPRNLGAVRIQRPPCCWLDLPFNSVVKGPGGITTEAEETNIPSKASALHPEQDIRLNRDPWSEFGEDTLVEQKEVCAWVGGGCVQRGVFCEFVCTGQLRGGME